MLLSKVKELLGDTNKAPLLRKHFQEAISLGMNKTRTESIKFVLTGKEKVVPIDSKDVKIAALESRIHSTEKGVTHTVDLL